MKAYLATTGVLFVLLAAAHLFRVVQERHLASDPWFVVTTILAIVLAGWAFRLYRSASVFKSPSS